MLANDVGLSEERLNNAYSSLEALAGASSVSLNAGAYEGDAPSVNRIEGRVLREMRLAQRLFNESREAGVNVPALIAGPSLKAIFGKADAVVVNRVTGQPPDLARLPKAESKDHRSDLLADDLATCPECGRPHLAPSVRLVHDAMRETHRADGATHRRRAPSSPLVR